MNGSHGYPRPQLRRREWTCLNGTWEFALDLEARWTEPGNVQWNSTITVPFVPGTDASGVSAPCSSGACWYKRPLEQLRRSAGDRHILHFGAVDYAATVWLDGQRIGSHRGASTPFEFDLTPFMAVSERQTLVVQVEAGPPSTRDRIQRSDRRNRPERPGTTGIWQTVWLESIPTTSLASIRWTPDVDHWQIGFEARIDGERRDDLRLAVTLSLDDQLLASDVYSVSDDLVQRTIVLADPGTDDARNDLLWTPFSPKLIRAQLELRSSNDDMIDQVESYTALRSISVDGQYLMLNGRASTWPDLRPFSLRLAVDHGLWPESGRTPPNDEALRDDVEWALALGFNGVWKHQKLEDPRYLYWADQLGLLVLEEVPSVGSSNDQDLQQPICDAADIVGRDYNHPCVIGWVLENGCEVPRLARTDARKATYHFLKALDSTRLVVSSAERELDATDIVLVGAGQDEVLSSRAGPMHSDLRNAAASERGVSPPGYGKPTLLRDLGHLVLDVSAAAGETDQLGYTTSAAHEEFFVQYDRLLASAREVPGVAGFCYNRLIDTFDTLDGLLDSRRKPKIAFERIAQATVGPVTQGSAAMMQRWALGRTGPDCHLLLGEDETLGPAQAIPPSQIPGTDAAHGGDGASMQPTQPPFCATCSWQSAL